MPYGFRIDDIKAQAQYDLNLSDQKAADQIGCHKKSFARWRRERKLPSNVPQGRPRKGKSVEKL